MDLGWISGPIVVVALVAAVFVWLRRMLDPRLLMEDATGEPAAVAAYLPSLIVEELDLLRAEGAGTSIRWASGTDEPIELPDTVLVGDRAKIITWLIGLLPRPTFIFSVKLIAAGMGDRPGLAVSLRAGGHQRGSALLWDSDFGPSKEPSGPPRGSSTSAAADDPGQPGGSPPAAGDESARDSESQKKAKSKTLASDAGADGGDETPPPNEGGRGDDSTNSAGATESFHRLAQAAAAWLAYRMPTNDPRGREHALLTADWKSYAHLRIGATPDVVLARVSMVRALRADPNNRGALHNLAVLDVMQHCYGPALQRLASTVALLGDVRRDSDRLWYRTRFNLAAAAMNYVLDHQRGLVRDDCLPPQADAHRAYLRTSMKALSELIDKADGTIDSVVRDQELTRQGIHSNASLLAFLREVREAAEIARADVQSLQMELRASERVPV